MRSNEAMAAVDTAVAESFEARVRTSLTSFFSRPPFSVKNLRPLRLYGRWLAVIMMAPSMAVSSKMMDMNMAGVEARPQSVTWTPRPRRPAKTASFIMSAEMRESWPTAMRKSPSFLPNFWAKN